MINVSVCKSHNKQETPWKVWTLPATYPPLPWVRSRVWVRVRLGSGLASGKGWVGTWPLTRLDLKVFCAVFIHSLFYIIKFTRSQGLAYKHTLSWSILSFPNICIYLNTFVLPCYQVQYLPFVTCPTFSCTTFPVTWTIRARWRRRCPFPSNCSSRNTLAVWQVTFGSVETTSAAPKLCD